MKNGFRTILIASMAVVAITSQLPAQQLAGQLSALTLSGTPVTIPVFMTTGLGDMARGGAGSVLVDPSILQTGPEFRQYLLAHEAGHAVGLAAETDADAYAGRILRVAGFSEQQMSVVYNDMLLLLSRTGDWTHPPSPQRVEIVRAAYEGL